jgi:hypothetical protein
VANLFVARFIHRAFVVLLLSTLGLFGCSKKDESSQMKIALPDWKTLAKTPESSALAAGKIRLVSRVMINITGPDIQTQVRIWSLNDIGFKPGDPIPTPPASFTFDVRRGSDRLFQVLAIVQEFDTSATGDSEGPMSFYYGDVIKSLSRDIEDVSIQLASLGVMGTKQGNISGRYIDASGAGPTAKLNMYYAPPGRPEMILDTGMIFSGFFDVGFPTVAQFSYRLSSGQTLFDKVTINSFDSSLGPQFMRIEVPAGYNDRDGTRELRAGRTRLLGFIGPGSFGKLMCYGADPEPLQDLYVSGTIGDSARVNWNAVSSDALDARVNGGGMPSTSAACSSASEFGANYLKLSTQALAHGDSPLAVSGPFQEVLSSTKAFVSGTHAGSDLTLSWKYLKPTLGDSVDGVGIFTKVLAAGESVNKRWQDSAPCSMLVSNFGFKELTRVAAGTAAAPVQNYVISNVQATDYAAGKHVTLICPYSNARGYYDFALIHSGNSGYAAPSTIATKLVARRVANNIESTSGFRVAVAEATCTPIIVRMTDLTGNDAIRVGATGNNQVAATLVGAPTFANLYDGPDCASGAASTKTYSFHGSQTTVWVKTSNGLASFDLQLTDVTAGGTPLMSTTFYGARFFAAVPDQLSIIAPSTVTAHQCFRVLLVQGANNAGNFVPVGASATFSLSALLSTYAPDLGIYSGSDCAATVSAVTMSSFQTTGEVWVKSTAPGSIVFLPGTGLGISPPTITVNAPGTATILRIEIPSNFGAEVCQSVRVKSYDANGNPSPASAAGVVTFTYDGSVTRPMQSGAYADDACSSPISTVTIGAGSTESAQFYMRFAAQGPVAVSGTTTNSQAVPLSTVGVGPAPVSAIIARVPEVSWTFGSGYVGYGSQRSDTMNGAFNIILEARSPMGNLVTTFNEPNILTSGIHLRSQLEPVICTAAATWSAGVATLASCWFTGGSAAGYGLRFETGGAGTPYPHHQSTDQFAMAAAGENGFGTTYLLARPSSYASGICQPVMVQRRHSGLALPVTTAFAVSLAKGSNVTSFHTDPLCASGEIFSTLIAPGKSESVVYMLLNGTVPNPTAAGASLFDPYTYSSPGYASAAAASAPVGYQLNAVKMTMEAACEPIMAVLTDTQGSAVTSGALRTLTFSQAGIGATFHATSNCGDGPAAFVVLPAGQSTVLFYYRAMTISSGSITVNDGNLIGTMSGITVNGNGG